MKKNITVFSKDKYMRRKIELILAPEHEVRCADLSRTPNREELSADLIIWNISDAPLPKELASYSVTVGAGGNVPLPFSEKMLLDAIAGYEEETPVQSLTLGEKCAHIYGKTIRLTDAEFALLSMLFAAGGEFVSRERLIHGVFGDSTTNGILNVYIHYLREKIEINGEKIIISSRKFGYKIDEKFLCKGGRDQCSE